MEAIHKKKGETARVKALKEQVSTPQEYRDMTASLYSFFFLGVKNVATFIYKVKRVHEETY